MSRRMFVSLAAAGLAATLWIAVGSCRSSDGSVPREVRLKGPGATPPPARNPPVEKPKGSSAEARPAEEDPAAILARFGVTGPTDDAGIVRMLRGLADEDDATLRKVLIALWTVQMADAPPSGRQAPKWDLPDAFGERLLKLTKPRLKHPTTMTDMDDPEFAYLLMLLTVLARMQYEPALKEFMKPDSRDMFGEFWGDCIASFGKTAFEPVLEWARGNQAERPDALGVLGKIRDPDAIPEFQRLLDGKQADERIVAVRALREMGVPIDLTPWRQVLENKVPPQERHRVQAERWAAVELLAQAGGPEDIDYLLKRAEEVASRPGNQSFEDPSEIQRALDGIIARGDPKGLAWVLDFVRRKDVSKDVNSGIREPTIVTLGNRRVQAAMPVLLAILNDPTEDRRIRWTAGYSLKNMDQSKWLEYDKLMKDLK